MAIFGCNATLLCAMIMLLQYLDLVISIGSLIWAAALRSAHFFKIFKYTKHNALIMHVHAYTVLWLTKFVNQLIRVYS